MLTDLVDVRTGKPAILMMMIMMMIFMIMMMMTNLENLLARARQSRGRLSLL